MMTSRELSEEVRRRITAAGRHAEEDPDCEALSRVKDSVRPEPVDPKALLEQIRRRHEKLGPIDLSAETIRELRDEGRP